jgi:hypothetical protein
MSSRRQRTSIIAISLWLHASGIDSALKLLLQWTLISAWDGNGLSGAISLKEMIYIIHYTHCLIKELKACLTLRER